MARILIADDDKLMIELLQFRLEGVGHQVITAENGVEAMAIVEAEAPDLVILDSVMPAVAGPEVLARLRSDPETDRIPIVMLTAQDGEQEILAALEGGANEYVTKPFTISVLMARIEKLLNSRD